MNYPSSPFVEALTLNGVFDRAAGAPITVSFGRKLFLDEKGFNESFSMQITLDKGQVEKPLDEPCIAVGVFDTYNMKTRGRSFPVSDFLADRGEKFQRDLTLWFRPDEGMPELLANVFNTVRDCVTPDMAEPLPKPARSSRKCLIRL